MLNERVSENVLEAVEASPQGIAQLNVLESLGWCSRDTLKTTLSRLNARKRILRLTRGVYSTNPMKDAFTCAQRAFHGYLGFTSALSLHALITENPFTLTIVTTNTSATKRFGEYEFRAVALKDKATGFEQKNGRFVSTRAKTLFDCLYLPRYSVEYPKLIEAFRHARLNSREWREFDEYALKLATGKARTRMRNARHEIRGDY